MAFAGEVDMTGISPINPYFNEVKKYKETSDPKFLGRISSLEMAELVENGHVKHEVAVAANNLYGRRFGSQVRTAA